MIENYQDISGSLRELRVRIQVNGVMLTARRSLEESPLSVGEKVDLQEDSEFPGGLWECCARNNSKTSFDT